MRGFDETEIYAKVPGYLKAIYVDKGDRVHAGQVLAKIESPETDQQVANLPRQLSTGQDHRSSATRYW